jgi:hypothetical protein
VAGLEERLGPVAGFEILGTAGDGTFFRIDFRDGTFWGRYLWEGESLGGLRIFDERPAIVVYPTATDGATLELQAFELGSDVATHIAFPGDGRLVVSPGKGEIRAERVRPSGS